MKKELTQERLKELLHYDPETGVFTWIKNRPPRTQAGDEAGFLMNRGYRQICISGVKYLAHRLAWFYHHGVWPTADTDHINGVRIDNRIQNLREATRTENSYNAKIRKSNTSGVKGVAWYPRKNRWRARLTTSTGQKHLGMFTSLKDAAKCVQSAREKYHGAFVRHG